MGVAHCAKRCNQWRRTPLENLRFIFTGGPGAGKTTVLDELAARGYQVVPESARAIIRERISAGLSREAAEGTPVLDRDVANWLATPVGSAPVMFDRGIPDSLGTHFGNGSFTEERVHELMRLHPYNHYAFILPPWREIYTTDEERIQTWDHAVRVFESLSRWYLRLGFELIEVPRIDIAARADFVDQHIRQILAA